MRYAQQGRAKIRRLRPSGADRPARMSRAAHAVENKALVRIEVAVSPRPCLGCAVELACTSICLRFFFTAAGRLPTQQERAHTKPWGGPIRSMSQPPLGSQMSQPPLDSRLNFCAARAREKPPPPSLWGRGAARPARMSRAAHAPVESKALVRIEVAVSPHPCLDCAAELGLRLDFFCVFFFTAAGLPTQQERAHTKPRGGPIRSMCCYPE
jgi:hypothetical protein